MTRNEVTIFGLLPADRNDWELGELLEPWLGLSSLGSKSSEGYHYKMIEGSDDDDVLDGVASNEDELLAVAESAHSCHVGMPRDELWASYEDLPLVLSIHNREGGFFVTPLYQISLPGHLLSANSELGRRNIDLAIELAVTAHAELETIYTYGFAGFEPSPLSGPDQHPDHRSAESGTIESLHWLNILSPEAADQVGRETLNSAPAYRNEELDDGSYLLIAQEDPMEMDTDAWVAFMQHFDL